MGLSACLMLRRSTRPASHEAELQLCGLRYARLVPGRMPDQLDVNIGDAVDRLNLVFHLVGQGAGRRAVRCRQSHLYSDRPAVADRDVGDEPEVIDIHRDFGIEDQPQGGLDALAQIARTRRRLVAELRGHRGYSVFVGCSARSRAAISVCQGSVAHFTRTGNSRTPLKIASLSSLASAAAPAAASATGSPV